MGPGLHRLELEKAPCFELSTKKEPVTSCFDQCALINTPLITEN
jgi:hypothetical protein